MSDYHRNRAPGGTYFFTANLQDRRATTLTTNIALLRDAIRVTKARHRFHIDAWVVLPEHTHCLWTLPPGDADFSTRWQAIKALFSRTLPPCEPRTPTQVRRADRGIWQRRFWEPTIRDDADYAAHMDYIHFNPVKHGLVENVADWPHSTFHRYVRHGLYPPDWATNRNDPPNTGEPRSPTPQPMCISPPTMVGLSPPYAPTGRTRHSTDMRGTACPPNTPP
jgi:putative transposase